MDIRPAYQRALPAGKYVGVFNGDPQVFLYETGLNFSLFEFVLRKIFIFFYNLPIVYPFFGMQFAADTTDEFITYCRITLYNQNRLVDA